MQCMNEKCDNELSGRQRSFCSDRCRKAVSRTNTSGEPGQTVNPDKVGQGVQFREECVTCENMVDENGVAACEERVSYQPALCSPDRYASRTNPEKLNWGEVMSSAELANAGLKANRVPIPGDFDYEGVCEMVDGVWKVA